MKKVIVHTFPPVPKAYSISPFGIKVESYLRVKEIPYDIVYTSKFGPKGKIPYIHLVDESDGDNKSGGAEKEEVEVIPDSNVIIRRLGEEFGTKEDFLSLEQRTVGHAITRMLEEHTIQIGFYYRYVVQIEDFMEVLQIPNYMFCADKSRKGAFIAKMFTKGMPKGFAKKMKMRGLMGHTQEELWEFSNHDLRIISDYLGDKKYFFGGDDATTIDSIIFAHLSQFVYIPLTVPFPQLTFMKEECENLLPFVERFRSRYWPDWEDKCQRQLNQQYLNGDDDAPTGSFVKRAKLSTKLCIFTGVAVLAFAIQRYRL